MHSWIDYILEADRVVWYHVNVLWQNTVFDFLAPIFRNPKTWIPLYLFLAIFLPYRFRLKGLYWCLGFLITFGIGDYFSASIIKPLVQRIRPCNDEALRSTIHLIVDCGSGFSFPSAHATNHFALATFMIVSLGQRYRWIRLPLLLWAFSIAYAQIYVGVHYPVDVLCGGILGVMIGWITGSFFNKKIGLGLLAK